MPRLCITEEELARDLRGFLSKVREGVEVVVQDSAQTPVRLLRDSVGRTFSEMLARIPKNSPARMDDSFAQDVLDAIESRREPLDSSKWD